MRKFLLLSASLVMLLAAVPAQRAEATPPIDVQIVVESPLPSGTGPFTAYGPAVADGIVCDQGDVEDVFASAHGFQSNQGVNLQILKLFTCGDGSGEFLVKLQVRLDADGAGFRWNVVDGTGAYVDLHGTGAGTGFPLCGLDCVLDVYDGKMHVD